MSDRADRSSQIEIATRDGRCRSFVYRPPGSAPWPGVLVYMDGIGIRPAMLEVGERLAGYGYFVLLPDLFYRSGPYPPMDAKRVFADPNLLRPHCRGGVVPRRPSRHRRPRQPPPTRSPHPGPRLRGRRHRGRELSR